MEEIGWMDTLPLLVITLRGPVQTKVNRLASTAVVVVAIQSISRDSPTVVPSMGLGGVMVTMGGSGSD